MSSFLLISKQGWFVQYIDRSYMKRREELEKLKKADLDEEIRQKRLLAARAEAARAYLEQNGRYVRPSVCPWRLYFPFTALLTLAIRLSFSLDQWNQLHQNFNVKKGMKPKLSFLPHLWPSQQIPLHRLRDRDLMSFEEMMTMINSLVSKY